MNNNINTAKVIEYLKHQAETYKRVASELVACNDADALHSGLSNNLVDRIKNLVTRKNQRVYQLAKKLGTPQNEIRDAIQHDNDLKIASRGWVKLA